MAPRNSGSFRGGAMKAAVEVPRGSFRGKTVTSIGFRVLPLMLNFSRTVFRLRLEASTASIEASMEAASAEVHGRFHGSLHGRFYWKIPLLPWKTPSLRWKLPPLCSMEEVEILDGIVNSRRWFLCELRWKLPAALPRNLPLALPRKPPKSGAHFQGLP